MWDTHIPAFSPLPCLTERSCKAVTLYQLPMLCNVASNMAER